MCKYTYIYIYICTPKNRSHKLLLRKQLEATGFYWMAKGYRWKQNRMNLPKPTTLHKTQQMYDKTTTCIHCIVYCIYINYTNISITIVVEMKVISEPHVDFHPIWKDHSPGPGRRDPWRSSKDLGRLDSARKPSNQQIGKFSFFCFRDSRF